MGGLSEIRASVGSGPNKQANASPFAKWTDVPKAQSKLQRDESGLICELTGGATY